MAAGPESLQDGALLWLVRHAARIDFADPAWRDSAERPWDPPLSDEGRRQAERLAAAMRGLPVRHIVSSPFLRCLQTARPVARVTGVPIKLECGVTEFLNDEWFAQAPFCPSAEQRKAEFPEVDVGYRSLLRPAFPETREALAERTARVGYMLVEQLGGGLLIVGHGATVCGIAAGLLGSDPLIRCYFTAIVELVRRGGRWELSRNGDTSHLPEPADTTRLA